MEEIKKLTLPLTSEQIKELKAGDKVEISGIMYTGRDAAHKRLVELLANKFNAVPNPTRIPPKIQPKNRSSVSAGKFSHTFKNNDNTNVPIKDFTKKTLPILK